MVKAIAAMRTPGRAVIIAACRNRQLVIPELPPLALCRTGASRYPFELPPFSTRRSEGGSGLPMCCNRDEFVPNVTLGLAMTRTGETKSRFFDGRTGADMISLGLILQMQTR